MKKIRVVRPEIEVETTRPIVGIFAAVFAFFYGFRLMKLNLKFKNMNAGCIRFVCIPKIKVVNPCEYNGTGESEF